MATYGSRDKNPFNAPKTYKINGVDTASNLGTTKYYTLVEADGPNKGQITIKSPTVAGSLVGQFIPSQGANTDRTVGVITPGKPIVMTPGSATVDETRYFTSVVGQTAVKGQAQSTAQKAGLNLIQSRQLTTPNAATDPGTTIVDGLAGTDAVKEKEGTRNEFPKNLVYPTNLAQTRQDVIKFNMIKYRPKTFSQETFGFSERLTAGKNDIIGTVILPIPNGISDANAVTWGGADMNAAQAAAVNIATSGIEGGGSGLAAAAENVSKTVIGASDEVQKAIVGALVGEATGIQGILARTAGLIINPNLELLFSAPTLRPFNFSFKLASRSPAESKMIRSIIRFFKQGMSPIRTPSTLFLKAPHTFQIEYLHRGEEHKFLNKFKECALQSFNVSYTPEGQYATFDDGAMVSYQITMQFQELEPVFNDDYTNDGTNPSPDIGF